VIWVPPVAPKSRHPGVLPPGATMLSVDVAGEQAKPVLGTDGIRVPLLRAGFRPEGPYAVSFVYLHAGQPFARRGETQMTLPQVDVPVTLLEWELFLPDRFSAKPLAGNVIPARRLDRFPPVAGYASGSGAASGSGGGVGGGTYFIGPVEPGQLVGRITDEAGAVLPGVTVTVTGEGNVRRTAVTNANGVFTLDGVPSGRVTVTSQLAGFSVARRSFTFDQRPRQVDFRMRVAGLTETVTVDAEAPLIDTRTSEVRETIRIDTLRNEPRAEERTQAAPSQNVLNLQQRVAGVLPVRVDVPRAGTAYRFVKPLVLDEETTVTFRYKTR
jgi:carboxypeptidase family protein